MTFATEFAAALGVTPTTSGAFGASTLGGRERSHAGVVAKVGGGPEAPRRAVGSRGRRRAARRRHPMEAVRLATQPATAAAPPTVAAPAVQRLAVLPFENLGRPDDAYVVDGLSDEIRSKLAGVPGVQVIARASSNQYRATSKPLQDVARELGVRYLLTGTVRSEPAAAGKPARVRVTPELVEVAAADTAPVEPVDADARRDDGRRVRDAGRHRRPRRAGHERRARGRHARVPRRGADARSGRLRRLPARQGDREDGPGGPATQARATSSRRWRSIRRSSSRGSSGRASPRSCTRTACRIPRWRARRSAAAERAIALAPQRGTALRRARDVSQSRGAGSGRRARGGAARAARSRPATRSILRPLAISERQQGRIADALRDMRAAAERDPRNARHRAPAGRRAAVGEAVRRGARRRRPRAGARAGRLGDDREPRDGLARAGRPRGRAARARGRAAERRPRGARRRRSRCTTTSPGCSTTPTSAALLALGPDAFDGDRHVVGVGARRRRTRCAATRRARARSPTARSSRWTSSSASAPNDAQRHLVRGLALADARPRGGRRRGGRAAASRCSGSGGPRR